MNNLIKIVWVVVIFSNYSFAGNAILPLNQGAGSFVVDGGEGRENLSINVHYNLPKGFTADSPVLIVLPGSGRTANKYRDRWISSSEKHNVLILSLSYSKQDYPKSANYNLGRMVSKENGKYMVRKNMSEWTFSDLDRVFDIAVEMTGSNQKKYDIFGHSAGGQFAHRFVMFNPHSKANRVLAANSGWYTTTEFDSPFPYGLANGPLESLDMQNTLRKSFSKKLVIFLGDKDDENEKRGSLRRNKEVDKQGLSRIKRGKYFFNKAKNLARKNNYLFNWELSIVKNVGHSSTRMSLAAADYLYIKQQ